MISNARQRLQLGQLLVDQGTLTPEQLEQALNYQRETNSSLLLGEVLRKLSLCSEEDVMQALANAYGVPFAKISPRIVDPKVMQILPREFLERHSVLPLFKVRNRLALAINEPANVFLLEEVGRITGCEVLVVCAWRRTSRPPWRRTCRPPMSSSSTTSSTTSTPPTSP